MQRNPPDILITTPESLYLLLTSRARRILASVETVIVDEIHAVARTKRGAHLFLSLERLEALRPRSARPLQRVGLSATQRPLEEVARLLGGFAVSAGKRGTRRATAAPRPVPRPVTIVDASHLKELAIEVRVPAVDMGKLGESDETSSRPASDQWKRRTILAPPARAHRRPHPCAPLDDGLRQQPPPGRAPRRRAERGRGRGAGAGPPRVGRAPDARAHRGPAQARRSQGHRRDVVARAGIDMGAVDLVVQVEAPPSVASGLQRIGRAGHSVGEVSRGVIFPKHRGDSARVRRRGRRDARRRRRGDPLPSQPARRPGPAHRRHRGDGPRRRRRFLRPRAARRAVRGAAARAVRRGPRSALGALPVRRLRRAAATHHVGFELPAPSPRAQEPVTLRWPTRAPSRTEDCTGCFSHEAPEMPEDGPLPGGSEKLDEEMVFELREGEVFLLGASSWRAEEIRQDRVLVSPAAGEPGKMPFWHGDRAGRPLAFGESIGALARERSPTQLRSTPRPSFAAGTASTRARPGTSSRTSPNRSRRWGTSRATG